MELITKAGKRTLIIAMPAIAVFVVALILIGTFFDYQIANWIGFTSNTFMYWGFGFVFEVLGMLPAILVNIFFFMALSVFFKRMPLRVLFHILSAFFLVGAVWAGIFWPISNHITSVRSFISLPIAMVVGVGLSFPLRLLFKRFSDQTLRRLIYILLVGWIMGTLANAVSGSMQALWGRYRHHTVVDYGTTFTHWFQPIGRTGTAEGHGSDRRSPGGRNDEVHETAPDVR